MHWNAVLKITGFFWVSIQYDIIPTTLWDNPSQLFEICHPKSRILFVGYMVIGTKIEVLIYVVCIARHIL